MAGWVFMRPGRSMDRPAKDELEQVINEQRQRIQSLELAEAKADEKAADLARQLHASERRITEQRQIIRDHALDESVRSAADLLALFPAKFPDGNWEPADLDFEDCWFQTIDGLRLHGWYLGHEDPRAVVLFAHGNAGNLSHRAAHVRFLRDRFRVSVFVFDYRGYGRSEGVPTVDGLVRDARAACDYLAKREGIAKDEIVLLGRSLGGALAVRLASEDGARGVILESTFSSLSDVAKTHFPRVLVDFVLTNDLDSASGIAKYQGPLLQGHGDADQTIPYSLGRKLFDAANEPKTFVTLRGRDHNDPPTDEYYQALEEFLSSLASRSSS
ncbi:MAG: alpha/beta hydrolase [Planctomycetes bacterium]|nr:alpha/beta hydrolase [Planctomycetota bacterium]MBL7039051.1 alpha/beta hydrolase [Pirellulaceae bacterium]